MRTSSQDLTALGDGTNRGRLLTSLWSRSRGARRMLHTDCGKHLWAERSCSRAVDSYQLNRCAPRATLASTDAATMRVPRFWHFGRPVPPSDPDDGLDRSRAWRDSGLADEVQAFLAGRLVNHLAAYRQPVPAWAALNRLAHADRSDLLRVLEGANTDSTAPSSAHAAWAAAERFAAGHLLARAHTPEELRHVQRATLVPLELVLIEQTKIERLTADQVLGCRGGGQVPLRAAERPRQHRLAPRRRPGPRPGTGWAGQA